jgi:ABC-type antimicrobial peptide transport system permease subunit
MSETAFPINDLLRRRLQTGLTVLSLTTCVAASLFLLLFSGQIGFGIATIAQDTLTIGVSAVFSQFLFFVGALIFVVGAIIVSFIVFLMMAQRTKDFGLMKATGCPNSLVFGYFLTELLGVTFVGCILGVVLGLVADYAVINMSVFQVYNKAPNLWFVPLVFVTFVVFALIFGAKPLFDAARMSPIKAISPLQYLGLSKGNQLKVLSKKALFVRIASRSLFRRKSATIRIVIFLSAVFLLLTICLAGSIIANDTSTSWIQKASGENLILVAHNGMANQYTKLLLAFSGTSENLNFNYSDAEFAISDEVIAELTQTQGVKVVDARLVLRGTILEISGYTFDPETLATLPVGDHREGDSLIIGINPSTILTKPVTTGNFLNASSDLNAVIGDSIAQLMYKPIITYSVFEKDVIIGDALLESVRIQNTTFKISGICIDPLNNGEVTYITLDRLESITGIVWSNVVFVKVDDSANYASVLAKIQGNLATANSDFSAVDLNQVLNQNVNFLSSLWSVVMFLPIFALASAVLCLISYLMMAIDEQHQEFAILRATGGKPRAIITILAVQSLIVLLSSFALGSSIGIIITIFVLVGSPVVSVFTVLIISGWLLAALLGMFLVSLYPTVKFSRKPLVEIMS